MLQHDAQVSKCVLKEEVSIHYEGLTPFSDRTAHSNKDIERNSFMLCFLDTVPRPQRCDMRIGARERVLLSKHVICHDRGEVLIGNSTGKPPPGR